MKKVLLALLAYPTAILSMDHITALDPSLLLLENADHQYVRRHVVFAGMPGVRAYMQEIITYRDGLISARQSMRAEERIATAGSYHNRLRRLYKLITNLTVRVDATGLLNELVMVMRGLQDERDSYMTDNREEQIDFEQRRTVYGACRDAINQAYIQNNGLVTPAIAVLLQEIDQIFIEVDQAIAAATVARYEQQHN